MNVENCKFLINVSCSLNTLYLCTLQNKLPAIFLPAYRTFKISKEQKGLDYRRLEQTNVPVFFQDLKKCIIFMNKQHFTLQKYPEYEYTCILQIVFPSLHRRDLVEKLNTLQITNFRKKNILRSDSSNHWQNFCEPVTVLSLLSIARYLQHGIDHQIWCYN